MQGGAAVVTVAPVPQSKYLTTAQVADLYEVSPNTVRRWVEGGHLVPALRTPTGQMRFSREAVEADLASQAPIMFGMSGSPRRSA